MPYDRPWAGLRELEDRFAFHYYHQRGCGESSRPFDRFEGGSFYSNMTTLERTLGLGAQIADLERIRQIMGQDRLTLIGHSYGGFLATLYAAEFPDHVEKLILVAPAGVLTPADANTDLFAATRRVLSPDQQGEFDAAMEDYFDFGNIFSKSDEELAASHARVGSYLLMGMGYDPDAHVMSNRVGGWSVFAMYFSAGRSNDYRPALAAITAPTLMVHGEDDLISLPGAKTYLPIKEADFVMIPRESPDRMAGHFIYDENPNAFALAVGTFLGDERD